MQRLQARSGVSTFAGQARQSLPEGRIQAFDKRRIQHASPLRELEQPCCLLKQPVRHLARDLHDALFLGTLDHRPNVQFWPNA